MYHKGKYINGAIRGPVGPTYGAVCFNEVMGHDEVGRLFVEVYGAGFFHVENGPEGQPVISAYGESVSLKVKSDPNKDIPEIRKSLGLG